MKQLEDTCKAELKSYFKQLWLMAYHFDYDPEIISIKIHHRKYKGCCESAVQITLEKIDFCRIVAYNKSYECSWRDV